MCGGVVIPPTIKEKRRNSEKRKEKSRDAARCRRNKESEIFSELSAQLPLSENIASQLDKASVMRLTVGFLKVRHMLESLFCNGISNRKLTIPPFDSFYTEVFNGFLLVLAEEGSIIYLSDNVDKYLGITQVEMMNHSIFEFAHPCDHDEIKELLAAKLNHAYSLGCREPTSFFIRMKSTVTSKGRNVNLKSASYQVIHYVGHRIQKSSKLESSDTSAYYLISIGSPIPHPSQIDILLDKDIFLSKHSPDMKFIDVDERIKEFVGYTSSDVLGKSVFSFHHASDTFTLAKCFKTLFAKGQVETGYYRFLKKYGGHVWVLTQATVIFQNNNNTKPESVVCLNYVIRKGQNEDDEIVSAEQVILPTLPAQIPEVSEVVATVEEEEEEVKEEETDDSEEEKEEEEVPVEEIPVFYSCTKSLFAPKEDVMSKSFLSFPDSDLLFQEPIKDPKLSLDLDLFPDDPCTISSNIQYDTFIGYREDSLSSPSCGTPDSSLPQSLNSKSPDRFSTTPSTPDSDSLSDMPNLDPINEFANLDLRLGMSPTISDKDCDDYETIKSPPMSYRAPFIPMTIDDDLPLSPSNSVMWGPQEPTPKRALDDSPPKITEVNESPVVTPKTKASSEPLTKSSLAALLQSDLKKRPVQRHEKQKSSSHRDSVTQKRWQNSYSDSKSSSANRVNGNLQKHSAPVRNGSSNGHIIMLDAIPGKKNSTKTVNCHRRNGHNADHSQSPTIGSHTATVKVNDRLIKVQVSVSELPSVSIEHKHSVSSQPDSPPKRSSPSFPGPIESPKRLKVDSNVVCTGSQAISTDSVLLNLLISGEDASRGYLCSGNSRYSENKYEPAVISLPAHSNSNSMSELFQCPPLLASESELLDSFLNISQYDTDVNAPIQSSHLLQGEDLLSALDQQPLLRDVPALV